MGEVWKAKDTKLGREVAIKTLPEEFAQDADRLARFEREAKLPASLNHPNIAAIHGFEEDGPTHFLVMELVEGDTLADRVGRGAIPVEESLKLAVQIADALKAAHEKGVIHRDLKPANIKVTDDNSVKVLDFGLAKAFAGEEAEQSPANSPTLSMQATQQGVILGTAAYMSPEQAKGRTVDKRADVWAFGCVLYEMLTGRQSFGKSDVTESLSAVISLQPEWTSLPANLHPRLRETVERCLRKQVAKRYQDIGDVNVDIEKVLADPSGVIVRPATEVVQAAPQSKMGLVAATSLISALIAGSAGWMLKPAPVAESGAVIRFSYLLGESNFSRTGRPLVDISRDGTQLAYVADAQIYLRNLNETEARPVVGTDKNPSSPFFSPDGLFLGFWSDDGGLQRVPVAGGTPVALTPAEQPFGVTWNDDNTIVYGTEEGIRQVSGNGGSPELIVEAAEGEQVHGPQILPGGTHILYSVTRAGGLTRWNEAEIVVEELGTDQRTTLWTGGSDARYLETGHLIYAFENDLFALSFDLETLTVNGGPVSLVPGARRATNAQGNTGTGQYAISDGRTLVSVPGNAGVGSVSRLLEFLDRDGNREILPAPGRQYDRARISPDGTRIAAEIFAEDDTVDIWIYSIAENVLNRLTFDGGLVPLWTPDGEEVTFRNDGRLWNIRSDFSGVVTELAGTDIEGNLVPSSWSPDGQVLLFSPGIHAWSGEASAGGAGTVEESVSPVGEATFAGQPEFSPDGRWFVYNSNDTGRSEIYAYPFPVGSAGRQTITTDGGTAPTWPRNRDGLIFLDNQRGFMQSVDVRTESTLARSNPVDLFSIQGLGLRITQQASRLYDVDADGERIRFSISESAAALADEDDNRQINIVLKWFQELTERVPVN